MESDGAFREETTLASRAQTRLELQSPQVRPKHDSPDGDGEEDTTRKLRGFVLARKEQLVFALNLRGRGCRGGCR